MLRRRWERVEAVLVDWRRVRDVRYEADDPGATYQVSAYVVDVPAADGPPVRLTIEEQASAVVHPTLGAAVPVFVNPQRSSAVFDLDDPRIGAAAARGAGEAATDHAGAATREARAKAQQAEAAAVATTPEAAGDLAALEAMEAAERLADGLPPR